MATKVKKEKSEKSVQFAKGGNTRMFGQQQAEKAKAGQTGDPGTTGKGAEFAKGGGGKMFGFAASQPARAGITSAR